MLPPPKYTRRALEDCSDQPDGLCPGETWRDHIDGIDDDSTTINSAPPPAYSRHANQTPPAHNAPLNAEEGNSSSEWPLRPAGSNSGGLEPPTLSRPQQAYSPGSHRNGFVEDVRAWNAFQVLNLNNGSGGVRIGDPRSMRTRPRYGYGFPSDDENDEFHDRPLRNPKYRLCQSQRALFVVATCIVIIIFVVAIVKGVAFFQGDEEDQDGGLSHKPPQH